jgi:Cu(I)/Ag(I) efflux system protein CusF
MTRLAVSILCLAWAWTAAPVGAQQASDHAAHHPASGSKAATMADGEVRRIDKEAKKITLRHGEIKNLDMPPMTMVFQVQDAALLDKVRTGDKVRFQAEKAGSAYIVVAIEPVK